MRDILMKSLAFMNVTSINFQAKVSNIDDKSVDI